MERFFWVKIDGYEPLCIGHRWNEGDVWNILGCTFEPANCEVTVGVEIHPSRTGLLAALNDVK